MKNKRNKKHKKNNKHSKNTRWLRTLLLGMFFFSLPITAVSGAELSYLTLEDRFPQQNTYSDWVFGDVRPGDWFSVPVETVYEYGIMTGIGPAAVDSVVNAFSPQASITLAEVVTIAARLHSSYQDLELSPTPQPGQLWYQPYVDYALEHKMASRQILANVERPASRQVVAYLLANSLPIYEYDALSLAVVPQDVETTNPFAPYILQLYDAGILQGSDASGNFEPYRTITRAETSAILARMIDLSLRKVVRPDDWVQFSDEDLTQVSYSWSSNGSRWSLEFGLPQAGYQQYRDFDREKIYGYRYYASEASDDAYLRIISDELARLAEEKNLSDRDLVDSVIDFVQSTVYQEDLEFINKEEYPKFPMETLIDKAGDCEDTSVLLSSLLHELGYGTALVEFDDHMGVAIKGDDSIDGFYYLFEGERYYYIETTDDGWEVGEIDDSLKDKTARLVDPWN